MCEGSPLICLLLSGVGWPRVRLTERAVLDEIDLRPVLGGDPETGRQGVGDVGAGGGPGQLPEVPVEVGLVAIAAGLCDLRKAVAVVGGDQLRRVAEAHDPGDGLGPEADL